MPRFTSRTALVVLLAAAASIAATSVTAGPAAAAAPANDSRAAATVVPFPGSVTGSTVDATAESAEPLSGCASPGNGKTAWFRTTVPGNGTLNVDTLGSGFDTMVSVFAGDGSSPLRCNDDVGGRLQSALSVPVTAGTYDIQVRGFSGDNAGFVRLTVDFGEDPPYSAAPWTLQRTTTAGSATMLSNRVCAGSGSSTDRWIRFVPSSGGMMSLDTIGSSYDTVLTVLSGTNLAPVACNDDDPGSGTQSRVSFNATAGTRYYVLVSGYSSSSYGSMTLHYSGPSLFGLPSEASIPPPTVPGAPTDVMGAPVDGAVNLTWTAPASNGGTPITEYLVTASDGTTTRVPASPTSTTMSGLANGTAYTFTVRAINDAGYGATAQSPPLTPRTVPTAPLNVSGVGGDHQVTVTWAAPSADGGAPIDSYVVTGWPQGGSVQVPGDQTSAVVTGLTNGTAYTFTVHATNAAGDGPMSATSSPVTPRGTPGAPTDVSATAGNGQATVTWAPPMDDGGAPITRYAVSLVGGRVLQVAGDRTSVVVKRLTNGTSYTFRVRATNAVGDGAYSDPSTAVTPTGSQPDGLIRPSTTRTYVGDDVYNAVGGVAQTAVTTAQRGLTRNFVVRLQNDGPYADRFMLSGPGGGPGFKVTYLRGSNDVTAQMVDGTYLLGRLAPGKATTVTMTVAVKSSAVLGAVQRAVVTATSASQGSLQDAVVGKVKVVR